MLIQKPHYPPWGSEAIGRSPNIQLVNLSRCFPLFEGDPVLWSMTCLEESRMTVTFGSLPEALSSFHRFSDRLISYMVTGKVDHDVPWLLSICLGRPAGCLCPHCISNRDWNLCSSMTKNPYCWNSFTEIPSFNSSMLLSVHKLYCSSSCIESVYCLELWVMSHSK